MDWLDWSFWQWLGAALALAVTVVGIKFAFTFDLNKFFEERRNEQEVRLQKLCPHTIIRPLASGEFRVDSCFHTYPGTIAYICNQCGFAVTDDRIPQEIIAQWSANPAGWIEADKRFREAHNKFHGI